MQVLVCTHFWNLAMNHEIPWKIMNMFVNSILLTEACCLLFASRCFQRSVKLASLRHLFAKDFVLVQPPLLTVKLRVSTWQPLEDNQHRALAPFALATLELRLKKLSAPPSGEVLQSRGFFSAWAKPVSVSNRDSERGSENVGNTGPNGCGSKWKT